jgi:hypothetical protein
MGCLYPRNTPEFAPAEFGFHMPDAPARDALYRAAGFTEVTIDTVDFGQITADGTPTKRYTVRQKARA